MCHWPGYQNRSGIALSPLHLIGLGENYTVLKVIPYIKGKNCRVVRTHITYWVTIALCIVYWVLQLKY